MINLKLINQTIFNTVSCCMKQEEKDTCKQKNKKIQLEYESCTRNYKTKWIVGVTKCQKLYVKKLTC